MWETNMRIQGIAIYVEDETDWQDELQDFFKKHALQFDEFISTDDLRTLDHFPASDKPIFLFMDLGLDNASNFLGYSWLLNDLPRFREKHANSAVFVLSGFLNEPITRSLRSLSIPQDHIFPKMDWAEDRDILIDEIMLLDRNMKELVARNILQGLSGKNIDPYLIFMFQSSITVVKPSESLSPEDHAISLPMLIRTNTPTWDYHNIPDLIVTTRIGNIFCATGSLQSVSALQLDSQVVGVEASRPAAGWDSGEDVGPAELESDAGDSPSEAESVDDTSSSGTTVPKVSETGDQAVIGFIDSGVDIFHEAFLDADGKTRILALWHQGISTDSQPEGVPRGKIFTQAEIDVLIQRGRDNVPPNLKEGLGHGTHVASIAAGSPFITPDGIEFGGGVAPESPIVFVVPAMEVKPSDPHSIGYSMSHLEALEFIKQIADYRELPVVINVSQGMNAGAHDGQSYLEAGFDSITEGGRASGIVVVKSAGNLRKKAGHARTQIRTNSQKELQWTREASSFRDDVLEVWFDLGDEITFTLIDPDGQSSVSVGPKDGVTFGHFFSGYAYKMDFNKNHEDNGKSQLIVVIRSENYLHEPKKKTNWRLILNSGRVTSSGFVDAWLERNDLNNTYFTDDVNESTTITIPGTAKHVICVGAIHSEQPFRPCKFSGEGPTLDERHKPDVSAPGYDIPGAKAHTQNELCNKDGTSMAAPHISGAIALAFSHVNKLKGQNPAMDYPSANQIIAALTRSTYHYNGQWVPDMGYGPVNIPAFLELLGYSIVLGSDEDNL